MAQGDFGNIEGIRQLFPSSSNQLELTFVSSSLLQDSVVVVAGSKDCLRVEDGDGHTSANKTRREARNADAIRR